MKSLADVQMAGGAATIDRKNRQRLVMVTANVSQGAIGTKASELQKLTKSIDLQPGYTIYFGGQNEMMQDSFRDLLIAMILAIILVYMVLAGSLESLVQPVLSQAGVNIDKLHTEVEAQINRLPKIVGGSSVSQLYLSQEVMRVLDQSAKVAAQQKDEFISCEHVLLAILEVPSAAQKLLQELGLRRDAAIRILAQLRG